MKRVEIDPNTQCWNWTNPTSGSGRGDLPEFLEDVKKANLIVDGSQVSPYVCLWYNGTDSYMSELTLAAFKEKTT